MPRPHPAEVQPVGCGERAYPEPFGNRDYREIDEAQLRVVSHQVEGTSQVRDLQQFDFEIARHDACHEAPLGSGSESLLQQAGDLRQDGHRDDKEIIDVAEPSARAIVPPIVLVCERVQNAGIDQDGHQRRRRAEPAFGDLEDWRRPAARLVVRGTAG